MESIQHLSAEIHDILRSTKQHTLRLQHTSSATMHTLHKLIPRKGWRKGAQVQPMMGVVKGVKSPPVQSITTGGGGHDLPSDDDDGSVLSPLMSEDEGSSVACALQTSTGTTLLTPSYTMPHMKHHPPTEASSTGTLTLLDYPQSKSPWRFLQQQQHGLRKAVTWIGQPLSKILRMGVDAADSSFNLDRYIVYDANRSHLQPSRSATYTTRRLHCRVLQISNFASAREYQYELAVQLNGETIHTMSGLTKKVTKGVSAASPQQTFTFTTDGPFELNLVLTGRPLLPASLADGFARVRDACSNNQTPRRRRMPVLGSKQLLSGDSVDAFVSQGICRYTLTQPLCHSDDHANMEVMLMFRLDRDDADHNTLFSAVSLPLTTTTAANAQHHLFHSQPDDASADNAYSITLHDALEHCRRGDHLTFYVRGQGHPLWIRYYVKLQDRHMLLYSNSSQDHLVDTIPLDYMRFATRPTSDDQERVYMSSTSGTVLQFDRNSATFVEPARLDESEALRGNVYFYADNDAWAACWRHALALQAKPGAMLKRGADHNRDSRVNLRYMW